MNNTHRMASLLLRSLVQNLKFTYRLAMGSLSSKVGVLHNFSCPQPVQLASTMRTVTPGSTVLPIQLSKPIP